MTGRMSLARPIAVSVALTAVTAVAGCSDPGPSAVGLAEAGSAVVAITADGLLAYPGSTPAEAARVGSGFLVGDDGLLVTLAGAVVGAGTISVRIAGRAEALPATLVGASECADLAVLRIDGGEALPFFAWRSGAVEAGEAAHAVALTTEPGDAGTLRDGTVSAAGPLAEPWATAITGVRHDVAVSAADAGGPLLDDDGRVAAVLHAEDVAAADDAGDDTLGAVAAVAARDVVARIVAGDDAGSLGISAQAWTDAEGGASGVWVRAVAPGGRAAAAGILAGDVVRSLDGVDLGSDATLTTYCDLSARSGDDPVAVEVYRPGTDQVLAGDTSGAPLSVVSTGEVRRSGAFSTVVDASGLVRVDAPVEWADVDGTGFSDGRGATWYSVVAAPSAERFRTTRTAPGVQVAVTGGGASAGDLLTVLSAPFAEVCSPIDAFVGFDDGRYAGAYSRFLCDRTVATVLSVRNARGNNVAVVTQVISAADQQHTLPRILSTFDVGR